MHAPPDVDDADRSPARLLAQMDHAAANRSRGGPTAGADSAGWDWAHDDRTLMEIGMHLHRTTRTLRAAATTSAVLQPAVTVPAGFLATGWAAAGLGWGLLITAIMAAVPVGALLALRATRRLPTLRLSGRARVVALATICAYETASVIALAVLRAPPALLSVLAGAVAGLAALGLAQSFTKASVHTGVIAIFAGAVTPTSPPLGVALALLATIAGWSRIAVGAHTRPQALALPAAMALTSAAATGLVAVLAGSA